MSGRSQAALPALRRRLEQLAAVHREQWVRGSQHDLAIFTDDELKALSALARKADTSKRLGQPISWTAEEILVLDRLEAKRRMSPRW